MYKKYQIKWLLILSSIMIIGTALLGKEDLTKAKWWHFLDHAGKIFIPMAGCWLIDGYVLTTHFSWISGVRKHLLSIIVGVFVLLLLGFIIDQLRPENYLIANEIGYKSAKDLIAHLGGNTFLSLICYFVFYDRYTSARLKATMMEKALLEQAHLRAQLTSLQQQISPHFLFNSLSTLKTMVSDPPAKNYIVHLAGVYRYVLSYSEQYIISLDEELSFIGSYLHILHERFGEMLRVRMEIRPEHRPLFLPPLSLQLLIENAIKHNVCSREQPLLISISTTEMATLKVENNFQPKRSRPERRGMGLKNIMERYKLLGDQSVEVANANDKFTVTLPLLNDESNHNRR